MAKSLYVGNLPWTVNESELTEKFSEFGAVISARIVSDRQTGRSRGFGFVDMEDADAAKALEAMNGTEWGGRKIVVNEARPKSESKGPREERQPRGIRNF